jgi:hypothetical protein
MRRTLVALLLAVGVLSGAVVAPADAHRSHGTVFFLPNSVGPAGNGTDKDKLDARPTTMPECRMIDPTDRDSKYACLVGERPTVRPAGQ